MMVRFVLVVNITHKWNDHLNHISDGLTDNFKEYLSYLSVISFHKSVTLSSLQVTYKRCYEKSYFANGIFLQI